jgi:hypothetical protein
VPDFKALKARALELEQRAWNLDEIESRFKRILQEGLPGRRNRYDTNTDKQSVLANIQRKAEEYAFLAHS